MGVTFHTGSNPRANLPSLPSALTAPHTGRAAKMLLAPASKFSLPYPALEPAGCAGGAGALRGQAGDSASPAPELGMLQGPFPWLICSPQDQTAVLGNFWELPVAQHFLGLQLLTAWQEHGKCRGGVKIVPRYFREHLPSIGVHTHRAPVELPVPRATPNPEAGFRVIPRAKEGPRAGNAACCILRLEGRGCFAQRLCQPERAPGGTALGSWARDLREYSASIRPRYRARARRVWSWRRWRDGAAAGQRPGCHPRQGHLSCRSACGTRHFAFREAGASPAAPTATQA